MDTVIHISFIFPNEGPVRIVEAVLTVGVGEVSKSKNLKNAG